MIEPVIERTIVVRDSDPDDESRFVVYVRDATDVEEDGTGRHIMMPDSVWLNLDDTEALGHALIALAQAVQEEREPVVEAKPPAKRAAPRKRAARKTASAKP